MIKHKSNSFSFPLLVDDIFGLVQNLLFFFFPPFSVPHSKAIFVTSAKK